LIFWNGELAPQWKIKISHKWYINLDYSSKNVPVYAVVALGLGGLCKIFGGPLSYVEHAKIFPTLSCENVVTATCFVHISIPTGTSV